MTLEQLRSQYPVFIYKKCASHLTSEGLEIEFSFELDATHQFEPTLLLEGITQADLDRLTPDLINDYVFNIGLVEMLSYWKTTCSPTIVVEAGPLDVTQIAWWHDLLIKGLGEFFFVNQIDFTSQDFVTIKPTQESVRSANTLASKTTQVKEPLFQPQPPDVNEKDLVLIPVGGGKDSAVTVELLKKWSQNLENLTILHLNPAQADTDTAEASQIAQRLFIRRKMDPLLFEMNGDGFLNGHTPFSALLAFLSTFVAHLRGQKAVALSNERSSNEGNVMYHGVEINHQYSKSFEFEQAFQAYAAQYLPGGPWYFSLLRTWYELQIAQQFARTPEYHSLFRSCNRGKKTNAWCGECSKCLFAYVILVPFIGATRLQEIFGKDILNDEDLLPIAQELVGYGAKKPLECVGTSEESLAAFYLSWQWYTSASLPVPKLLQKIVDQILSRETKENLDRQAEAVLTSFNQQHSLPPSLATFMERQ